MSGFIIVATMSGNDGVLLEDINHKLSAILEGQQATAHVPRQLTEIDMRLQNVESDVKVIKAVVTDQSSQLKDHKTRITALEHVT